MKRYWLCDHGNWYSNKNQAFDEQFQSALTEVVEYSAVEELVDAVADWLLTTEDEMSHQPEWQAVSAKLAPFKK